MTNLQVAVLAAAIQFSGSPARSGSEYTEAVASWTKVLSGEVGPYSHRVSTRAGESAVYRGYDD